MAANSKTKMRYFMLIIILSSVIIFILSNLLGIRKIYMTLFHKTGVVGSFNANHKLEGVVDVYTSGNLTQEANFKNGLLYGWKLLYYPNGVLKGKAFYKNDNIQGIAYYYYEDGKIKSKESFKDGKYDGPKLLYYTNGQIEQNLIRKNGKDEGLEHGYYKDGKLMYTRNWINDKQYGDQIFYFQNGRVKIYHTYDILGAKFYLSHYNETGKNFQTEGRPVSHNIYSKDIDRDSSILLEDNKTYKNIRDLYITYANPPNRQTVIQISINGKIKSNLLFIDNNTAKIVAAFPQKGVYNIRISGGFIDNKNDGRMFSVTVKKNE